ncbi:redoxin family protein [Streptomyces stramineus]
MFGLSSQDGDYQREFADRLGLPFPILSDPDRRLADALDLPTFRAGSLTLFKRLTLIVRDGEIEHAFYPIFPPDQHARQVLTWLRENPSRPAETAGQSTADFSTAPKSAPSAAEKPVVTCTRSPAANLPDSGRSVSASECSAKSQVSGCWGR